MAGSEPVLAGSGAPVIPGNGIHKQLLSRQSCPTGQTEAAGRAAVLMCTAPHAVAGPQATLDYLANPE
jgi:hypothetical protein